MVELAATPLQCLLTYVSKHCNEKTMEKLQLRRISGQRKKVQPHTRSFGGFAPNYKMKLLYAIGGANRGGICLADSEAQGSAVRQSLCTDCHSSKVA
jgi:hypothetical protein